MSDNVVNLLLVLARHLPEPIRKRYPERLRINYPQLKLTVVDSATAALPHISDTDVLITYAPTIAGVDLLKDAGRLKWIQALTTGMDGIIDQPSLRSDIIVTSMKGIHGAPVSEAALMAMLALARKLPNTLQSQVEKKWQRVLPSLLHGKTVGILGVGLIGEALATRCKAFGMNVVGISSTPRKVEGFDGIVPREKLAEAVADFDYLVAIVPYSKETHHMVDRDVLMRMKHGSYLINVARGGVVDESALIEVLQKGPLAGAALDVFSVEPLPSDHALWSLPNVIITPHLAGIHDQYAEHALVVVEENLRCFLAGDFVHMINSVPH